MATYYDITMGNDIVRDAHFEITMGDDVARDIHCDVTMSNSLVLVSIYMSKLIQLFDMCNQYFNMVALKCKWNSS